MGFFNRKKTTHLFKPQKLSPSNTCDHCLVLLLLFYVLATYKVISGRIQTCDSAHSCHLYTAAGAMTYYPTQSHCPNTEPSNPYPILIIPGARLGIHKYQFKSHWFDSTRTRTRKVQTRSRVFQTSRPTHSAMPSGPTLASKFIKRAHPCEWHLITMARYN